MIIEIDDWKFQVFTVTNRRYYAKEAADRCQCAWCRNFSEAVDVTYPDLRQFLDRFGICLDVPDEMMAFSPTLCSNYYGACGEILRWGTGDILVNGLPVTPETREDACVNSELDGPWFFLRVGPMTLPWVLEESMSEAKSPAKGKKFIQRLLQRWISEE